MPVETGQEIVVTLASQTAKYETVPVYSCAELLSYDKLTIQLTIFVIPFIGNSIRILIYKCHLLLQNYSKPATNWNNTKFLKSLHRNLNIL